MVILDCLAGNASALNTSRARCIKSPNPKNGFKYRPSNRHAVTGNHFKRQNIKAPGVVNEPIENVSVRPNPFDDDFPKSAVAVWIPNNKGGLDVTRVNCADSPIHSFASFLAACASFDIAGSPALPLGFWSGVGFLADLDSACFFAASFVNRNSRWKSGSSIGACAINVPSAGLKRSFEPLPGL